MKINKNEQDFVLKYFQPSKLDTRKALQKVKARVDIADEEVSHAATVSLRIECAKCHISKGKLYRYIV